MINDKVKFSVSQKSNESKSFFFKLRKELRKLNTLYQNWKCKLYTEKWFI